MSRVDLSFRIHSEIRAMSLFASFRVHEYIFSKNHFLSIVCLCGDFLKKPMANLAMSRSTFLKFADSGTMSGMAVWASISKKKRLYYLLSIPDCHSPSSRIQLPELNTLSWMSMSVGLFEIYSIYRDVLLLFAAPQIPFSKIPLILPMSVPKSLLYESICGTRMFWKSL
jgi:hypothetical protein